MIAAIRRMPSGRATAVSVHDPFPGTPPEGIVVRASVKVDCTAARISVDLRDNPDGMPCGFNLSKACAPTYGDLELADGETIVGISCGGGYAAPMERATARVAHDVAEGYVPRERAARAKGVVLDREGAVDEAATKRRLSELSD